MKKEVLQLAAFEAVDLTEKLFNETEKHMAEELTDVSFKSSEFAWLQYTYADQYAKYISFAAISSNLAAKTIIEKSHKKAKHGVSFVPVEGTKMKEICPIDHIEECIIGKYRSYTGHCNNIKKPRSGAAYEKLRRFLPADYGDGISSVRLSVSGNELASPRALSSLFTPSPSGHAVCSLLLAPFLSFIYDDMVHVPSNRIFKRE
ncbi:unnamed protein product [Caenorhabditis bovis]|uniref:Uncharacterized protein n=1 Tax=Caenorhabditis bovis TaxID=2654633 RepID=A0A8S1F561_9PELO|nr:unnamed protein product [Caenorhabditis bovis]